MSKRREIAFEKHPAWVNRLKTLHKEREGYSLSLLPFPSVLMCPEIGGDGIPLFG
jgi:hypothetical protein